MKKLILFLMIMLFAGLIFVSCSDDTVGANSSSPITFYKTYDSDDHNYDRGYSVQQTIDGGYIVTGRKGSSSNTTLNYDMILLKTDINGTKEWFKAYGADSSEVGMAVIQTIDSGYVVLGYTFSLGAGEYDIWLVKLDVDGNEEWNKTFGGARTDIGNYIQQTTDNGFIIVGTTQSFEDGYRNVWLIKTDENGNEEWNQIYGTSDQERGKCVQQTADGGYIITGSRDVFDVYTGSDSDVLLLKTDNSGAIEWEKVLGEEDNDEYGNSVIETSDGGFIIASTNTVFSYVEGLWILGTDSIGNVIWSREKDSYPDDLIGNYISPTTDDGFVIVGKVESNSYGGVSDIILLKYGNNGSFKWDQLYGEEIGAEYGYSVQETTDYGFIITGNENIFDILLIKTDENGNVGE
ncbi:MAG: hypothetical protein PF638_12035 [Candidatus Delongbacteria bacterium]|jgi:hypothetical protein|nr:hypothetical protein [Candidatus Delongbacteria bacterium]